VRHGTLDESGGQWRLRYERQLAHPPEKVWRALTEREHLAAWFPSEISGEWEVGAKLTFRHAGNDADNVVPPYYGEVLRWEPPSLLEFTWAGDTLRFEVRPVDAGSRLTLVVALDDLGKAARDGAGWHECLNRLDTHLNGDPALPPGTGWMELFQAYQADFGPAASTLGPPEGWEPPDETR
jgi:uncharacterized protein YndB with AHSA1/START domain